MSGTSMDAIDAALVDFSGTTPQLLATHSHALTDQLRRELQGLANLGVDELEHYAQLDMRMGRLFAEASHALLDKAGIKAHHVTAIGSHGQTVCHQPTGTEPFSLQIGNPSLIAEATGITTVADFRSRDIAAGGQGAPLVPAFHNAVFRSPTIDRVIVNIGGIANLTILPADLAKPVGGFDTGPGNTLLDAWIYRHLHRRLDTGGEWAASGKANIPLLNEMLSDAYFALTPPKSTGPEYFNLPWLETKLQQLQKNNLSPEDIQATLCELTASSIEQAIARHAQSRTQVLVCGGGIHNHLLIRRLSLLLKDCEVQPTLSLGVDPDWVEAMAFAWLAMQTLVGRPGNLPSVTGASHPVILGGIYKA